jgi:hypothetical protein
MVEGGAIPEMLTVTLPAAFENHQLSRLKHVQRCILDDFVIDSFP